MIEIYNHTIFQLKYLIRACSLDSFAVGSKTPVSRFTFATGFFSKSSPIFTRPSKFSFVETSTDDIVPRNVSS